MGKSSSLKCHPVKVRRWSPYGVSPKRPVDLTSESSQSEYTPDEDPPILNATSRVAVHVLIEEKNNAPELPPTPPSTPPESQGYRTRATAPFPKPDLPASQTSSTIENTKRPETHLWSFHEREALCLLRRVLNNSYNELAELMNTMFPCSQSPFNQGMMLSQHSWMKGWHGTIEVQGPYVSIWRWDFHQLAEETVYWMVRIEMASEETGVQLHFRTCDREADLIAALDHRQNHLLLFRNLESFNIAGQRDETPDSLLGTPAPQIKVEDTALANGIPLTALRALSLEPPHSSNTVGASRQGQIRNVRTTNPNAALDLEDFERANLPVLLWRCVGPKTPGLSGDDRVYSGRHSTFPDRRVHVCTDPLTLLDDAETHLCRHKCFSPLLSSTQSLCWALMKAYHDVGTTSERYIYTIDAHAAHTRTRVFAGHLLAKELRSRGRFKAEDIFREDDESSTLSSCTYRGHYDLLIYGEISGPALITKMSLLELETLAGFCPAVAKFLRLDLFRAHKKVHNIFREMRKDPMHFSADVAIAIAKLMRFFGVGPEASDEIVSSFFGTLLQNWCIAISATDQIADAIDSFIEEFTRYHAPRPVSEHLTESIERAIELHKYGTSQRWGRSR